jgi:hypothetical protein
MAAEVNGSGNNFEAATPHPLFIFAFPAGLPYYDVSSDGRRFLTITIGEGENPPLALMVNWTTRLQDK